MLIDVHAHYAPRRFAEALADQGSAVARRLAVHPTTDDPGDIETRIGLMDEAGVRMQVLSPGGMTAYSPSERDARTLTSLCNDQFAELARRRPDRFAAMVSIPLPHVDASLREIERGFADLGAVGVYLGCSVLGRSAVDPAFDEIYAELDRRSAVLLFHPVQNGIDSPLVNDHGLTTSLGAVLEDSVIVAHLIAKRIPERYPNLRIIVPHLGGITSVSLARLDNQVLRQHPDLHEKPSHTARRLFYDTVCHGSQAALTAAWMAFGADRLLPGSDYPVLLGFEPYRETFAFVRRSGLPADDIERILYRNAPSLFGF